MDAETLRWRALLRRQAGVVSRRQALEHGWSGKAITHRTRVGSWQVVLRGVLVTHSGEVTPRQRCQAALLHGGPAAALTGETACVLRGLRQARGPSALVHVAVPAAEAKRSIGFVRVWPTTRHFRPVTLDGLRVVAAERAVVDAALVMPRLDDVRALVAAGVQQQRVSIAELESELRRAPVRGSRLLRQAMEEVRSGARSAPEAALLAALRLCESLPPYELNVEVRDRCGRWLARPDVVFREQRVIVEVDGQRWHLSPERWVADVERHTRLEAAGWTVLRYPATRVLADAHGVAAEIADVLAARIAAA